MNRVSLSLTVKKAMFGNKEHAINIWVKSSKVKFNGKKSTLYEFIIPNRHFFIFSEEKEYYLIKVQPKLILQFLEKREGMKDLLEDIQTRKEFYLNGKKVSI